MGDEPRSEPAVVEFAEQFSVDVTGISDDLSASDCCRRWAGDAFGAVVLTYIADFVPRVLAGLRVLGLGGGRSDGTQLEWDHTTDPADEVFNRFLPAVAGRQRWIR